MDFQFLQNPISKKWVVLAPRRAKRPDVAKGSEPVCPFCVGKEKDEQEVYRLPPLVILSTFDKLSVNSAKDPGDFSPAAPDQNDNESWQVRVLPNKFPFAPIHEIIIHSPDHHKNFGELPNDQVELILQTYRQRYNTYKDKGQVYIFHNRGEAGGESLPHPHTQLAVVPTDVKIETPRLATDGELSTVAKDQEAQETAHFTLFCPKTSQWPDEVWVTPKQSGRIFGEITDEEIADLSFILSRLVQIMDMRHGHEFSYNFYIYPGGDWYLRLIPRTKTLGGFEIGTGIFVNTQDPAETMQFIKAHFANPDEEKISTEYSADYQKHV